MRYDSRDIRINHLNQKQKTDGLDPKALPPVLTATVIIHPTDSAPMPLGDPCGGLFEYTVEGLPESIFACTVPVSDVGRSIRFYTEALGMRLLSSDARSAYLIRGSCRIVLHASERPGIDTGLYLGVDSPFNTRRRLIDEGIEFIREPSRGPFGTYTSFLDPDGNVLHAIDTGAEFKADAQDD